MTNRSQAPGFGLIGMMISALLVAILAAVVLTVYMDSITRDLGIAGLPTDTPAPEARARLAEAHAVAGAVMMALTTCVQIKGPGQSCSRDEVAGRAGLNPSTFTTADGRWSVVAADLTLTAGGLSSMTGRVAISGVSGNAAGLSLAMFHTGAGTVTRCHATSATPPSGPSDGESC
ncbi:MAG TPA: hypothetical protein VFO18_11480 [Methylomirabilota bacterium]|nr:hypothetical protein [Methylomirabilota bacterium]